MSGRGHRETRRQCAAPDCDRDQVAKGWCLKHYKQVRRGVDPTARPSGPRYGEPSGHGLYGMLDDDGDTVLCHECGERFMSVAGHLAAGGHDGLTAVEYKRRHGLGSRTPLTSSTMRAQQSATSAARVGSEAWRRFEEARDPVAASHSRDDETRKSRSAQVDAQRAETAAAIGRSTRRGAEYSCAVCGVKWCQWAGHRQPQTCSPECWAVLQRVLAKRIGDPYPPQAPALYFTDVEAAEAVGVSSVTVARWRKIGLIPDRSDGVTIGQLRDAHTASRRAGADSRTDDKAWHRHLDELREFVAEHGRVPGTHSSPGEERRIAVWVTTQRKDFRDGKARLSNERIAALNAEPWWTWEGVTRADRWDATLAELVTWIGQHGRAPRKTGEGDEGRLARWMTTQRTFRRTGRLRPDQIARLDDLGWWSWKGRHTMGSTRSTPSPGPPTGRPR